MALLSLISCAKLRNGLLTFWIFLLTLTILRAQETKNPVRLELTTRNYSDPPVLVIVKNPKLSGSSVHNITGGLNHTTNSNATLSGNGESLRDGRSFPQSKTSGIVINGKRNPEELIRKALINHTLAHGGEEDLDKLVFSTIPQGSKLTLRTVKIIRTDENGDPIDDREASQPTYWDVTLANATDFGVDDEEDVEGESADDEDSEEDEEKEPRTRSGLNAPYIGKAGAEKKKPDLESSGSHSSANYHHLNGYGSSDRDKEHGKTYYHGNTHGKTHKQTHTVTDGKNVKPYHGTEKGLTDYAKEHGKDEHKEGERFKTSKRKNKGRKVSGFKRVYHKEEFQRTEHFFDDEEANRIAESFGLSEAKGGNKHGTKDDKRKYHGVRTEYLDGKKIKNEHGTHDGYNKGQQTTYKDHEKHRHHSDYGKSMSHGSPHDHRTNYYNHPSHQHADYHPNHNYHASHSSPRQNTVLNLPTSVADQIGYNNDDSNSKSSSGAIVSAPMATSFTVTEYSPEEDSSSTPDPSIVSALTKAINRFPLSKLTPDNVRKINSTLNDGFDSIYRKQPSRTRNEPNEKKIFFSPKHRPVPETDDNPPDTPTNYTHPGKNFKQVPSNAAPYQVPSPVGNSESNEDDEDEEVEENYDEKDADKPYAPNFGPPRKPRPPGSDMGLSPPHRQRPGKFPKSWRWPRRRNKHPRPPSQHKQLHLPDKPIIYASYPMMNPNNVQSLAEPLAISLRHSSAYNRLLNRGRHNQQPHGPYNYYEVSTRKSDTDAGDESGEIGNRNDTYDETTAHYFNHNHRYAKNYLTSTLPPGSSGAGNGVRNTLIDSSPGVYSTMIKVLPATLISVNESSSQHHSGIRSHPPNNALTASGSIVSVTHRPKSHTDFISITTPFPSQIQYSPPRQQHHRPFLPRPRWLSLNFNLGNPNYQLGHEFGPSEHPFNQKSKKVSHIMQGIKNGLLKPFGGRASFLPQHSLIAAPTMTGGPVSAFSVQSSRPFVHHRHPPNRHSGYRPPPSHLSHPHILHSFPLNHNYNPTSYNYNPSLSIVSSQSSKDEVRSVAPPLQLVASSSSSLSNQKRPKFYYNYKPTSDIDQNLPNADETDIVNTAPKSQNTTTNGSNSRSKFASKILRTETSTSTSSAKVTARISTSESSTSRNSRVDTSKARKHPPNPPPFMNGLMDTVSNFFGKMG